MAGPIIGSKMTSCCRECSVGEAEAETVVEAGEAVKAKELEEEEAVGSAEFVAVPILFGEKGRGNSWLKEEISKCLLAIFSS